MLYGEKGNVFYDQRTWNGDHFNKLPHGVAFSQRSLVRHRARARAAARERLVSELQAAPSAAGAARILQ